MMHGFSNINGQFAHSFTHSGLGTWGTLLSEKIREGCWKEKINLSLDKGIDYRPFKTLYSKNSPFKIYPCNN